MPKKGKTSPRPKAPPVSKGKTDKQSVGIASHQPAPAQRRIRFKTSSGPNDSLVTRGTEFLQSIDAPDSSTLRAGDIITSMGLNPSSIPGSRLNLYSTMFEKYTLRRMTFHFASACPTTFAGDYVMFIDRDAADTPAPGELLLRQAFSVTSMTSGHWWESKSVMYTPRDPQKFYYTRAGNTGNDARLEFPGMFNLVSASAAVPAVGTTLGQIWVDYEIHWYDPTIEPQVESASSTGRTSGTSLVQGPEKGFSDLILDTTAGVVKEPLASGGIAINLPALSGNTTVAARNVYDLIETFRGLNSGAPASGIVDAWTIQPALRRALAGRPVAITDPAISQLFETVNSISGLANGVDSDFTVAGFKAPDSLYPSLFPASIAQAFGIAEGSAVDHWHLIGTLLPAYLTATTHNLRVSRRQNQ